MSLLNICIAWVKSRIMPFHDTRVIAKPLGNLVQANPSTGKKAGKGVPHGVGSHPCKTVPFGVLLERSGEIISVTIYPMSDVGLEHVWLPQTVVVEELTEGTGKWYRAFLPIFEIDRSSLTQVQESGT